MIYCMYAFVAQWIEHSTPTAGVVGSTPIERATSRRPFWFAVILFYEYYHEFLNINL